MLTPAVRVKSKEQIGLRGGNGTFGCFVFHAIAMKVTQSRREAGSCIRF